MTIQELANEMNMPVSDVQSFVNCLSVWTSKGYSVEQAIEKHQQQMARFVNHAVRLANDPAVKQMAVDAFFPEVA